MPNTTIEQQPDWSGLPPLPDMYGPDSRIHGPYPDDLEARNDILHMRALVDAIEHHLTPVLAHDVPAGFERDGRGLIDTAIDTHLDADWPDDAAAELLAAWRTETAAVSA